MRTLSMTTPTARRLLFEEMRFCGCGNVTRVSLSTQNEFACIIHVPRMKGHILALLSNNVCVWSSFGELADVPLIPLAPS